MYPRFVIFCPLGDVDGVMDGKIDGFIKAYLMEFPVTDEE